MPTGVGDLTVEWLRGALGWHDLEAVVVAPIGTGQVADSVRLHLERPPGSTGPATVVAKVTAASDTSRQAAMATRTYEVEVGFYTDLAADLLVRTPHCFWAGYVEATAAYAVVLEDVAPAQAGDQLAGCSVDQAAAALDELALLHGPRWDDPDLARLPWLDRHVDGHANNLTALVGMTLPGFLERYTARLSPDVVDLVERFVPTLAAYVAGQRGPRTVVHGDFRNDNLLFGGERVCVVDWQTVALGPALSDVSYFLGGSLLPEQRRAHEDALVRDYHARLVALGVSLSWDECWRGYRGHAFAGLIMAIVASMLVGRTDRGDDMFVAMAERAGRHALDLDAEALLAP